MDTIVTGLSISLVARLDNVDVVSFVEVVRGLVFGTVKVTFTSHSDNNAAET